MRAFFKLICLGILSISTAGSAIAAVINVPCDYNSILTALTATAQEGDTVLIGPGDCTITAEICIGRGISFTLAGSGTNLTTLRSAAGLRQVIWFINNSTNLMTVRDLNLVGDSANSSGFLSIGHPGNDSPGPYHVYNIKMTNLTSRGISAGYGKTHGSYGLIDHVYMKSTGNGQFMDFEGASYGSWGSASPLGTTNAFYVEDCYFDNGANFGNGFFDAYTGAQFVFRHNICDGWSAAGGHGYDSGDISPRTWEVYNNLFTNSIGRASSSIMSFRGGTGLFFSNTTYRAGTMLGLNYYRSVPTDHNYGTDLAPLYMCEGVPGHTYTINFSGSTNITPGNGYSVNGIVNGQGVGIGFTTYYFVNDASQATFNMCDRNGYGGGAVLIGATLAESITNLFNAVNKGPGFGTKYFDNYYGNFKMGHEFIATGLDATSLYLRNALDGTNANGWPANQQIGVLTSYPLTGTNFVNNQVVFPVYCWSNTLNGVLTGAAGDTGVQLGRDFFNNVIPAPNIYTPLVYPHPLQVVEMGTDPNSSQLAPPTEMTVDPRH